MSLDEFVILALEVLGLLALAAGVGFVASWWVGAAGVGASGLVVLGGALLAAWLRRRPAERGR